MPSLDGLPSEILHLVAQFVGSDTLRNQAGILVLFKRWYVELNFSINYKDANHDWGSRWQVVQVVAFEDLTLSIEIIHRYLELPQDVQSFVCSCVKSLKIVVSEDERHHSKVSMVSPMMIDHRDLVTAGFFEDLDVRQQFWIHAHQSLFGFAPQLMAMPKLDSFSLMVFMGFDASRMLVDSCLIITFILLSSLPATISSLTIDNSGSRLSFEYERYQERIHFCSLLVNQRFTPYLRHLRIRSRLLCPDIFAFISSGQFVKLETLIINFSVEQQYLPWIPTTFQAQWCGGDSINSKTLHSILAEAAQEVTSRLPHLKILRINRHIPPSKKDLLRDPPPSTKLCSFNAFSGRYVVRAPNINWRKTDYIDDLEVEDSNGESSTDVSG